MTTTEIPSQTTNGAGPHRQADPRMLEDIAKFEQMLELYLAGELEEERFRVFRLNNGVYGQRQGGQNQMVRVKVPYGSLQPEQLEKLADLSVEYSRGWGHITTRQNLQFHFVPLTRIPAFMREMAEVGLTSREACGDTVRNVTGCHLAGACPFEVLDISPWAEATYRHLLRHPYAQRLPRKFKINFSGCATDCGQAMFNDVGVVAVARPRPDGSLEPGFRVFLAGGLGATPHAAFALEEFTPREELLATIEAALRTFDHYGNRDNKLRARMKWLADQLGEDELRRRIFRERKLLLASAGWPGGVPAHVAQAGDSPAGCDTLGVVTPVGTSAASAGSSPGGSSLRRGAPTPLPPEQAPAAPASDGTPVTIQGRYERWEAANVVRGVAKGTVSAYAHCRLGDVTAEQLRGVAALQRRFGADVRVTNRQNFVFRGLVEDQLRPLYEGLAALGMDQPGAELARDVVSCPGADTCNLAVTQSRGLADHIGSALEEAGLADVGGVRINISGCPNSCGQHHISDLGFMGVERRAHGRSAPGYQLLLGGRVGDTRIEFGQKARRLPARTCGAAAVRIIGRFAGEREPGEEFGHWMERAGGVAALAESLADLDRFPSPEEDPGFYVDFDEQAPFTAEVGAGECAGA